MTVKRSLVIALRIFAIWALCGITPTAGRQPENITLEVSCTSGCSGDTALVLDRNDTLSVRILYPVIPAAWTWTTDDCPGMTAVTDTVTLMSNRKGVHYQNWQFVCAEPGTATLVLALTTGPARAVTSRFTVRLGLR